MKSKSLFLVTIAQAAFTISSVSADVHSGNVYARSCQSHTLSGGYTGSFLSARPHRGYVDDGTLLFPNGQVFMRRNNGYIDDFSMFYPNGKTLLLRHSGYTDDGTLFWPNDKKLLLQNRGFVNHGSVFHQDGSPWLIRHSGYSDDGQRIGLPVDIDYAEDFVVKAVLLPNNSVSLTTIIQGDGWLLEINLDDAGVVITRECY